MTKKKILGLLLLLPIVSFTLYALFVTFGMVAFGVIIGILALSFLTVKGIEFFFD